MPRDAPVINTLSMKLHHRSRVLRSMIRAMRRTVRYAAKRCRAKNANVSCTMQPQFSCTRGKRLRDWALRAALCAMGIGASAVAGATSATSAAQQESLDQAWWTGPLLAPNAATLPQGHWL